MVVSSDILQSLESGVRTNFMDSFGSVESVYTKFTTKITSTKSSEDYAFLGETPQLVEFLDTRKVKSIQEYSYSVANKKWETTIGISRDAIEDDQTGNLMRRASQMGINAAKSYDREAVSTLEAGSSTVCYDGQNFFSTTHGDGLGATQSNYAAASKAFSATTLEEAITLMAQFQDDQGELAGMDATHLMVPSGLRFKALEVVNPVVLAGSNTPSQRVLSGVVDIIVNKYLTTKATAANSAWYLMDLSTGMAPIIFQERKAPEIVSLTSPTGDNAFLNDEFLYGVRARFNFAYGNWRSIVSYEG